MALGRRIVDGVAPARFGPGFRWLLASSWISNAGDGLAIAAGPLLVASQTRSPFLVAMAGVLQRLPWLLLGLYAGALADRLDRRVVVAVCDGLQAVVLFLTGVVTIGMTDIGAGASLGLGAGLAVLCVVAAGTLGRPFGYALGWLVQVISIALGFVITAMFFLGVVFAALWATSYFLGIRIDREKAERVVLEQEWQTEHESET